MDLIEAKALTLEKMYEHGLITKGWKFGWSNAKCCFGRCYQSRKTIHMSKPLCTVNERERVLRTILHEIAHALVGCSHGHDRVWKAKCIEIGGDGRRCYTEDNTNVIKRPSKPKVRINGVEYQEGDTLKIRIHMNKPIEYGVFVEYRPRNHKYPIVAKFRGKNWKFSTTHIES